MPHFIVICGSPRLVSQSSRVCTLIAETLERLGSTARIMEINSNLLPFDPTSENEVTSSVANTLKQFKGLIWVIPEWHIFCLFQKYCRTRWIKHPSRRAMAGPISVTLCICPTFRKIA
ncbi:MAG: hypothetical protein C7B46_11185 [Sulfobacillus benefaciens]|uniref:NADPH-dependent FMN reductase-like domain-containing protein n=1 Tax=Sulfobacillus benefaciens TaxID=453960 RepID=A0A2T2XF51_9FIRM|nr:MAG: hypothetical protein C7B46_11185 [Sulfobacillus benefaciens]